MQHKPVTGRTTRLKVGVVSDAVERLGLLGALLNHLKPALLVVGAFAALGLIAVLTQDRVFEAQTSLIVEDVQASEEFDVTSTGQTVGSRQESERYLSDQVEILRSTQVARIASDRLQEKGVERTPAALLRNRSVEGEATNNRITVNFRADTPREAKLGADALTAAYVELRQTQIQRRAERAREEVVALQAALRDDLDAIDAEVDALRATDDARRTLQEQFDAALDELNSLRAQREQAPLGSSERQSINQQIDELRRDFEAWEVVLGIERQSNEVNALVAQRDQILTEISALTARGNSIAVEAELESGGVVLSDPASLPTDTSGTSPLLILGASAILGLGVATAVAYYLDLKGATFTTHSEPADVLGAPLLADVPAFTHERITSDIPVLQAPESAAAEAFRFAAAALDVRAANFGARSVLMTSATVNAGKSVAAANTGIAAASEGLDILLVDADFNGRRLTSLIGASVPGGIAEVVSGQASLESVVRKLRVSEERYVSLLSAGWQDVTSPTFMRSDKVRRLFNKLRERFDLVIIDGPPLLQVAYASTLATLADSTIVIVEHGSSMRQLEEVGARLEVVQTPVLGYLYAKGPLTHAMMVSDSLSKASSTTEPARSASPG